MPQLVVSRALVPSHSQITDASEKRHYWTSLLKDWGGKSTASRFPGCNPLSISREMLGALQKSDYSITLKADGVRYILYCTVRPGSTPEAPLPVALMIDRSQNMYEVDVIAIDEVFTKHTIIEGELVWKQPDESALIFLVFDCVMTKGVRLTHLPFSERLKEATRCTRLSEELSHEEEVGDKVMELDCLVMMQYDPPVVMRCKNFVDMENATRLWKDRSDVQHRVDGLILQKNSSTYPLGAARRGESYKWKEKSTVDLTDGGRSGADGPVPATLFGRALRVSGDSKITEAKEGGVVEYLVTVTEHEVELFALRRRVDKSTANGLCVVSATVHDVIEAVRVDELA